MTATAIAPAPVLADTRRPVETRLYMAVIEQQAYDYDHDRMVWVPETIGPFPVLVGPGEPGRAESAARLLMPEGYCLTSWWPVASKAELRDEEF